MSNGNGNGNGNGKKKTRRRLLLAGGALVLLLATIGLVSASRGGGEIDPSKLAAVERGDIARSVVATGKIEPLAKVEVKSKASGIVKKILRRLRRLRQAGPGPGRARQGGAAGARARGERDAAGRAGARSPRRPLRAQQGRGRGARPAVPQVRAWSARRKLYAEGLIVGLGARGRREGLPDGAEQADVGAAQRRRDPRRDGRAKAQVAQAQAALERAEETCATRPSSAPWTAWCCRATSRWATRSAPSWCSARRPRW